MAYVVVQHLLPDHQSMLPELLAAITSMPVVQVKEGMALEPDRVHVIPPNVQMTVIHGRLHLVARPEHSLPAPIDAFFQSLAFDSDGHSVGIVLSGSASDGAQGLRVIKAAGGLAIAQEPTTARFDSMPRAAMATGIVDLVLPPEQIARELMRMSEHPFMRIAAAAAPGSGEIEFNPAALEQLFDTLQSASGVDFSDYKLPTIRRRLHRRMMLHRVTSLDEYLRLLDNDREEAKKLYRDLLVHVTRFFREPESFAALQEIVFPAIVNDVGRTRPIRIWVPGCATGEEPYSIAIALLEFIEHGGAATPIQVFGTDVSEEAVVRARAGVYGENIAADVSPERLKRFFSPVDGHFRVHKTVRDSCVFARQDLTRDPPFSKLDLIVCRNVLIYLGQRLQRKLNGVFHYALKPSGFLMVGSNETITAQGELFSVVDRRHKIYVRRTPGEGTAFDISLFVDQTGNRRPATPAPEPAAEQPTDVQTHVNRVLIERYSPPAVVVDGDFQILHTRGKTGAYLELASGAPSLNVLKLAREGLLQGLRTALHTARRSGRATRREGLLVRSDGAAREVDVQVVPLGQLAQPRSFLVLFEEPARQRVADETAAASQARRGRRTKSNAQLERMQDELASSREYLQSIIQDLEAANEELQSANEEILSSNEELQSTNEELDTAKEELQSTNEELNTVNDELNARNEELTRVNSDLVNLLHAVPAAVVIVSADLRIRRFTPLAESLLNLIPADLGRPIGDLKPNVDTPDLDELARAVMEDMATKELEVRDRGGRYYTLRIRPYKNIDNKIDGAVLAFIDVDMARRSTAPSPDADLTARNR